MERKGGRGWKKINGRFEWRIISEIKKRKGKGVDSSAREISNRIPAVHLNMPTESSSYSNRAGGDDATRKGTPVLKRRLRERREKERERENGSPLRFGDQTGALNCPRHNGVFRIIAFSVLRPIQERLAHSLPLSVSGWLWKLSSNLRNLRSTPRSASMWLVHVTPHEALRRTTWRRGPAEGTRFGSLCRHLISPGI